MPLDAELQPIVDLVNSIEALAPQEQSVDDNRAAYAGLSAMFGAGDPTVVTTDEELPGPAGPVPVRWYYLPTDGSSADGSSTDGTTPDGTTPDGSGTGGSGAGAIVYFHGGGWVIGSIDTHDPLCRELAARSGLPVVSVDYRLAPEHPYPAATEDCHAVTEWISDHADDWGIDPTRLVVAGDSAGGNLAALVTLRWSRDRPALAGQILIYPVTDVGGLPTVPLDALTTDPNRTTSLIENGTGYVLTLETMQYFADQYVPDPARRVDPDASPLRAASLSGTPPALVITAEFDPLRDEGEAYAERLADAGVRVVASRYDGATHMFVQMLSLGIAQRALDEIAGASRAAAEGAAV